MAGLIKFEGADELMSALNNAIRVSESSADAVVKNNTERAKKQAQKYAPVETWFLHDEIYTEYEPMTGYVHSPASYSGYQEFGTRFMSAQPFMRPALEWVKPKYEKDLRDVINGTLRRKGG